MIGLRGSGKTSSVAIGSESMRARIRSSPSANHLLPLTTALEPELRLEPRVAREVEEIARDIRRDPAKLRGTAPDGLLVTNRIVGGPAH